MSRIRISPVQFIPISFLLLILCGTLLLMLPFATASGKPADVSTALFTATTSVCVTGLVVVDTFSYWSTFGQAVILVLIQVGGLGVVTFGAMIMLIGKRKFSFGDRKLLGNALNVEKNRGLLSFLIRIFKGTFLVEGIGAVLSMFVFIPRLGIGKGIWASIFHSVSAFCNAGMDVVGSDSLISLRESNLLMIVTMALIVMGGLGFVVWFELYDGIKDGIKKRFSFPEIVRRLPVHSKVVLCVTAVLIIGGAVAVFAAEYHNPATIGGMSLPDKVINSLFQSVTFRTAGFASVPQEGLTEVSCVLGYFLMFIGGSPIGTAGGIKTVTAFLVCMNARSYITGHREIVIFNRSVSPEQMHKASAVAVVSLGVVAVMTILLMVFTGNALTDSLYEVTSALATVGLSRGLTPGLNLAGRIIVIISMYLGRIGPISMALFFAKSPGNENRIKHAEGEFYVG